MNDNRRFGKKFVGSKAGMGVLQTIVNQIPPHRVLIEPFAGEATIARHIRPPEEIILIDRVRRPGLVLPADRAERSRFILGDGIGFLDAYKYTGREFVYADPPYLLAARSQRGRRYYGDGEMSDADHRRFLRVAKGINCRVMISGYASPLYEDQLSEWRLKTFQTMTRGGTLATECLWMNYPPPTTLHDYTHLGDCWRKRQDFRRKIKRAVADLLSLPVLERNALFGALAQASGAPELATAEPPLTEAAAALGETAAAAGVGEPGALGENADGRRRRLPADSPLLQELGPFDQLVAVQLIRAFRGAMEISVKDTVARFDSTSTLAGTIAEAGRSFTVRVEVRPERAEAKSR